MKVAGRLVGEGHRVDGGPTRYRPDDHRVRRGGDGLGRDAARHVRRDPALRVGARDAGNRDVQKVIRRDPKVVPGNLHPRETRHRAILRNDRGYRGGCEEKREEEEEEEEERKGHSVDKYFSGGLSHIPALY